MSAARRARDARIQEHIAAGTHVPRAPKSHFIRPEIAIAMVQDIQEPKHWPAAQKCRAPRNWQYIEPEPVLELAE